MSALIDSISVQSEPLLPDAGHRSSVAMTTAVEEQATIIRNYDAYSTESVDQLETADTLSSKHHRLLIEEGAEQDNNIAMATVIENKDTYNSVPGTPVYTKAVLREASTGPSNSSAAKERTLGRDLKPEVEAKSDVTCTSAASATAIESCDAGNTRTLSCESADARGSLREEEKEVVSESAEPRARDRRAVGGRGDGKVINEQQHRDILFFMRDQQSQTELKQVLL